MTQLNYPERKYWPSLLKRPAMDVQQLETRVTTILEEVKTKRDEALLRYTEIFDKAKLSTLEAQAEEFLNAEAALPADLKRAIQQAQSNISTFHTSQLETKKIVQPCTGVKCWRKAVAIEKVGLYIPGGSAPLFSTILMLAVPAKLAGCREIVLCTPPAADGSIHPAILYTAQLCGITRVFKLGGVQAIGAMAYGTESVPAVYKIFGPGNQYVTCAKQLVNKSGVAIDMPAGPSELAVLADETCVPAYVAADLLSQAEHGSDSQVILVSTNDAVLRAVEKELDVQLEALPRKEIARLALGNSRFILMKDKTEALNLLNEYAPEHLIIACADDEALAEKVINAGSVFLGNYSCESAGDYASGTNHTLPTSAYAKAYSGVSLDSFVKKITFQKLTKEGIFNLGKTIELMAEAEGLFAHKNAVAIRMS